MPELGPKNLSFVKKLKEKFPEKNFLFGQEDKVLSDHDQEYIGGGSEVVVVRHKDYPEKLFAFNYRDVSPERAKEIFYLHRLFSTIFPHNFPRFYASSGKDTSSKKEDVSGTIRQEVKGIEPHSLGKKTESTFPFRKVEELCHELDIPLSIDRVGDNIILGYDGGEYYVDTLKFSNEGRLDVEKIIQYMVDNKYSPQDIEIVRRSAERLKERSGRKD